MLKSTALPVTCKFKNKMYASDPLVQQTKANHIWIQITCSWNAETGIFFVLLILQFSRDWRPPRVLPKISSCKRDPPNPTTKIGISKIPLGSYTFTTYTHSLHKCTTSLTAQIPHINWNFKNCNTYSLIKQGEICLSVRPSTMCKCECNIMTGLYVSVSAVDHI